MKKHIFYAITTFSFIAALFTFVPQVKAAGSGWNARLTPSSTSAVANGTSAITFDIFTYQYICSGDENYSTLDANECATLSKGTAVEIARPLNTSYITVSGSGAVLSATTFSTGSSGHASFSLTATEAGQKTVSLTANPSYPAATFATSTVTFTAPVAPAPASAQPTSPANSTAPQSPQTTTATQPPANTSVDMVKIAGVETTADKPISLKASEPLVLSGKTIAGGIVTITIHSTPRTVTATADKDGNWSYTVTDLEPGDHKVITKVTNPTTKLTSAEAEVLSFRVMADNLTGSSKNLANKKTKPYFVVAVVLLIILVSVSAFMVLRYLRKRKASSKHVIAIDPLVPPVDASQNSTDVANEQSNESTDTKE